MDSWGIESAVFWWCWGIAFALAVMGCVGAAIRSRWLRPSEPAALDPGDEVYELAFLNGGADLTVTAAAVKLHQGFDAEGAGELERSLLRALRAVAPHGMPAARHGLAESDDLLRLDARLQGGGLLRERSMASLERWSASVGFALVALACVRFAAEADISVVTELALDALFIGAVATTALSGKAHRLTTRGRTLLEARRRGCAGLRTPGPQADLPLAVALFGGSVLWHADPAFAAAWQVPRESGTTGVVAARGGCGGGSCTDGTESWSCG